MKTLLIALALLSPLGAAAAKIPTPAFPAVAVSSATTQNFATTPAAAPPKADRFHVSAALLELVKAAGLPKDTLVLASNNPNDAPRGCHKVCVAYSLTGLCLSWMVVCP
jgi:hypothetical protein